MEMLGSPGLRSGGAGLLLLAGWMKATVVIGGVPSGSVDVVQAVVWPAVGQGSELRAGGGLVGVQRGLGWG